MNKHCAVVSRALAGLVMAGCAAGSAQAAPAAEVSPPPLEAGFQVQWAQTDLVPHTIAAAESILSAPTTSVQQVLASINVNDGSVPFSGSDPRFAIRATGYVQLAAGDYVFSVTHDDGARLILGGEHAIVFDSDTGTVTTTSPSYTLAAGLYAVELLSWEQGGVFDLSFSASVNGGQSQLVQGLHAVSAVPEPAALGLMLAGLAGLGLRRRRG